MKHIIITLLVLVTLSACSTSPSVDYTQPAQECLDRYPGTDGEAVWCALRLAHSNELTTEQMHQLVYATGIQIDFISQEEYNTGIKPLFTEIYEFYDFERLVTIMQNFELEKLTVEDLEKLPLINEAFFGILDSSRFLADSCLVSAPGIQCVEFTRNNNQIQLVLFNNIGNTITFMQTEPIIIFTINDCDDASLSIENQIWLISQPNTITINCPAWENDGSVVGFVSLDYELGESQLVQYFDIQFQFD